SFPTRRSSDLKCEQLKRQTWSLAIIGEHVYVVDTIHRHFLFLSQVFNHLDAIAIEGGGLKALLLRSHLHFPSQPFKELIVLPLKQEDNIVNCLQVFSLCAETGDARTKATLYVVFEARPVSFPVDVDVASPQKKVAIDYLDGVSG